jgi:hypothetical protein
VTDNSDNAVFREKVISFNSFVKRATLKAPGPLRSPQERTIVNQKIPRHGVQEKKSPKKKIDFSKLFLPIFLRF